MKRYHKTKVGDTTCTTTHPAHDMAFDGVISRAEFLEFYGIGPEKFGASLNVDVAGVEGRVADVRCGEHAGRLHQCIICAGRDEIELWTGTALQDLDGYRWESE